MRKENKNKRARKWIHCQNPNCWNVLWHYYSYPDRGDAYRPLIMFCSRHCAGSCKSEETIAKQSEAVRNTLRDKKRRKLNTPKYEHVNEFATPAEAYD